MGFELLRNPKNKSATEFNGRMRQIYQEAGVALGKARRKMKKFADWRRKEAHKYEVGGEVLLSQTNIQNIEGIVKLKHCWLGPFKITQVLENAVKLDLPAMLCIHPVINVSQIKPYESPNPGDCHEALPPEEIEGELKWAVEAVIAARIDWRRRRDDQVVYCVKWKGYSEEYNEWVTKGQLQNAQDSLSEFYWQNLTAIGNPNHPHAGTPAIVTSTSTQTPPQDIKGENLPLMKGQVEDQNSQDRKKNNQGEDDGKDNGTSKERHDDTKTRDVVATLSEGDHNHLIDTNHHQCHIHLSTDITGLKHVWLQTGTSGHVTHLAEIHPMARLPHNHWLVIWVHHVLHSFSYKLGPKNWDIPTLDIAVPTRLL